MAEEIIEENAAVTTGRELLDATQNAVINAVENVSEIIENKEEKKLETIVEEVIEPKTPFYLETEFWVAMAFFLLLIGLIWPISKVVRSLLKAKINSVVSRIDNAVNLRDEAQKLLADYERKLISAKPEAEKIINDAMKKIEVAKEDSLLQLDKELQSQTRTVETKIDVAVNNVREEISNLICNIALKNVRKICSEELSEQKQNELIDSSIALIKNLADTHSVGIAKNE